MGCTVSITSRQKRTNPRKTKYRPKTRKSTLSKLAFFLLVSSSFAQEEHNLLPSDSLHKIEIWGCIYENIIIYTPKTLTGPMLFQGPVKVLCTQCDLLPLNKSGNGIPELFEKIVHTWKICWRRTFALSYQKDNAEKIFDRSRGFSGRSSFLKDCILLRLLRYVSLHNKYYASETIQTARNKFELMIF